MLIRCEVTEVTQVTGVTLGNATHVQKVTQVTLASYGLTKGYELSPPRPSVPHPSLPPTPPLQERR